jgi:hypothetical protein
MKGGIKGEEGPSAAKGKKKKKAHSDFKKFIALSYLLPQIWPPQTNQPVSQYFIRFLAAAVGNSVYEVSDAY